MTESLEGLALVGEEDGRVEPSDLGLLTCQFLAQFAQRGGLVAKEQPPDVDVRRTWWEGRGEPSLRRWAKTFLMLSAQVPPFFAAW